MAATARTSNGNSDFSFLGKKYKADEWIPEVNRFADDLAKHAKILEENRLPQGVDLDESQQKDLRMQLHAMTPLPSFLKHDMWSSFAARYLPALHETLKSLSLPSQKTAVSHLIQILTLIGDPNTNSYFRRYLQSSQAEGFAELVSSKIVSGVSFFQPSGPGYVCSLVISLFQWSPTEQGDDGKAAVNKATRVKLKDFSSSLVSMRQFGRLDEFQQGEIKRLDGILEVVESMPAPEDDPGFYLKSTFDHLNSQVSDVCSGKQNCEEYPTQRCTRCKTVRYCGEACQKWHWKNGHKLRCHHVPY